MKNIYTFMVLFLLISKIGAQISIDNSSFSYNQDFNSLSNTGNSNTWTDNSTITGWYSNRVVYIASDGSANTGGLYSYGSTGTSDRALGSLASGSAAPSFGIRLKNNTSKVVTSFTVSFTTEQWRKGGSTNVNTLSCSYKTGATVNSIGGTGWTNLTSLDIISIVTTSGASALDGNNPANRSAVSAQITVNIPVGQEIMIRWVDVDDPGSDDGLSMDDFSISSVVLPIELQTFRGSFDQGRALLSFSTATESNNDYFSIERSSDGRSFSEIGQVKGAGTSYEPQDYTFTDEHPLRGKNYYRLRQVDFDGKYSYSPVVTVTFGKASFMTLAPTAATESLQIRLEQAATTDGVYQVYDLNGRLQLSGSIQAETREQALNISDLPEGAYVLRLLIGQDAMVEQFRKLN